MDQCASDAAFGPVVDRACRLFDLTLYFEETVLTITPAAIFILAAAVRVFHLSRAKVKTARRTYSKILVGLVFLAWQVYSLATRPGAAPAVNVVAAVALLVLSWIEDRRSVHPSTLLATYLVLTVLLDVPRARTLWNTRKDVSPIIGICIKAVLLVVEEQPHRLTLEYSHLPAYATSGIVNNSFLFWLNRLIARGLHPPPLDIADLDQLDTELIALPLEEAMQNEWDHHRRRPERRTELFWALLRVLWRPMLAPVFPRVCMIALSCAQPFIVTAALNLLVQPDDDSTTIKIYALLAATLLLYTAKSVAAVHYNVGVSRAVVMSRGALVTLIYNRALLAQDGVHDDSAAVTLMSSDTAQIANMLSSVNNIWAEGVQVVIGTYLLARQLGWACLMPLAVVALCSIGSSQLSRHIGGHAGDWMAAVQKRVGATTSVLINMRSVKMLGLSSVMSYTLQGLRLVETDRISAFRWDILLLNVFSNIAPMFTPPLAFAGYVAIRAIRGDLESLDVVRVFTSISVMQLVTGPSATVLANIPFIAAAQGSYDRIQKFLLEPLRDDQRTLSSDGDAIVAMGLTVRPVPSADIVLNDVSFSLPRNSVTVVLGAVASGKTTLLRAVLGEVAYEGSVEIINERVAYCAQKPWLPNKTIKRVICGPKPVDEAWYRTCIRACALDHDIKLLPDGDESLIGSEGVTLSGGQRHRVALARAVYARAKIVVLDEMLGELDTVTRKAVVQALFGDGLFKKLGSTVLLVTHAGDVLPYADKILVLSDAKITFDGTYNDAKRTNIVDSVLETMQHTHAEAPIKAKDPPEPEVANLARQTGDIAVYKYYFRSIGWRRASVLLVAVAMTALLDVFKTLWLKWWTDAHGGKLSLYLTVYLITPFLEIVAIGFFMWSFLIHISPASANKMHRILLNTVMRAPQSFFSATPTGKILNMFSQDMTLIEGSLAIEAAVCVMHSLNFISQLGLISTVSPYLLITIPVLAAAVYVLQHIYLCTSRQLRYLDLEAKSPLFQHTLETLSGVTTIRAFSWQEQSQDENRRLLDMSQRPHYLLLCAQRWLTLVLGLIIGAQTTLVIALALGLRKMTDPGFLGVSLTTVIGFDSLLSGLITSWTQLEISLGSVARIKNFEADVQPEDVDEKSEPPLQWPSRGEIHFRNVTASHNPDAVALHDVTFSLSPGQKLGICGRTGSGKSSLVATLLRLLEIDSGSITVDGLDISSLPRDTVRARFIALPQEAYITPGSVRLNADPLSRATDEAVIAALTRVGLWTGVLEEREGGLAADINPSSLSKGQQQLLGLARALLAVQEGRKVLLLDEPTSSVDKDTDEVVRRVLREDCGECTVITVAHRIDSIVDADLVAVLDGGRLVEFGKPAELLERGGRFKDLAGSK